MSDTIDRQAAIDAVRSYYDECDEREESIEERIEQLPSADVVEVVRCADCKHWDASDIHSTICPNSRRCKGIIGKMYTAPDYYCAYGERKDE